MPARPLARKLLLGASAASSSRQCLRGLSYQTRLNTTKSRPNLPFLSVPTTRTVPVRYFTSARAGWLRHEAKLFLRYTIVLWGGAACVLTILWAFNEEALERRYPTPHEWSFLARKFFRDASNYKDPRNGEVDWARALQLAREVIVRLEDAKKGGEKLVKLSDKIDPTLEVPGEFIACDISAMSEEWRRGYFEALMLAAKAAEHVDGWVRDKKRNLVSPPEYVIGPSNPQPTPIPAEFSQAPREEDCELAYPAADNWYIKLMATKGLSQRQRIEAALEYASFMEYKNRVEGPDALYNLALAEATLGMDAASLPYNPKTFVLKDGAAPPSLNVFDVITSIATRKARQGDISSALPIYISILKARRGLSDEAPRTPVARPKREPIYRNVLNFFAPPDYPPPPPDGMQPPWRSPHERCHEAALNLYIGEILYATSSRDEGLAWTRDGVDGAEEQLRKLGADAADKPARQTCRECLTTGLGNWAAMVASLAREEARKKEAGGSTSSVFNFWGGTREADDRWAAEQLVVKERVKRTQELLEEVAPPKDGFMSMFKA